MSDLTKLTIRDVHAGLKAKKFSSEDLLDAYLKVIDEKNEELNAFITVDEKGARKAAKAVDKMIADGEDIPVLAGIPVAVKDCFNTKGLRTTCASGLLKDFVPPYDATVIEKLKAEGMVIIGKTNLDEFTCGASNEHSYFEPAKNPYDTGRVPGGSSGGSAVALAANMCGYAMGTDTGGSVRQPASFCGLYGMKVTYGRVSRSGVTSYASSFDSIGHFGRCAADIAEILNVTAGKDRRDMTTPDVPVDDYCSYLNKGVKGMKIGLPEEYFGEGVEKETADIVRAAVDQLEKAGAKIEKVSLPMTKYAVAVYYIAAPAELSTNLERLDGIRYGSKPSKDAEDLVDHYFKARGEGFGEEIKRRVMIGTYVLSAGYYDAYYKKAQKVRTMIIKDFEEVFKKVDVLIAPVSPFPAWKIGAFSDDPLKEYMADALTIPANSAGLPGLAVPAGKDVAGLPVGFQVIAPQFKEGLCIQVASAYEDL